MRFGIIDFGYCTVHDIEVVVSFWDYLVGLGIQTKPSIGSSMRQKR